MKLPGDWIIPDWPAPSHVRSFITSRNGGVSRGAYTSFNLGLGTGDDRAAVLENRARLLRYLPQAPRWLQQQHGTAVVDADRMEQPLPADASIARNPGTVCTIVVADCVPVLFSDRAGSVVAAAHAGWRGLAGGVLERTVERLGSTPDMLLAYLGPGIGPGAFEVGGEVRDAFVMRHEEAGEAFTPVAPGKWRADLYRLARIALARAGVTAVYGGGLCTVSDPSRFFSYRRDRVTGRMAAFIWREP